MSQNIDNNPSQSSTPDEMTEMRGQIAVMQAQITEMTKLQNQLADLPAMVKAMNEMLQPRTPPVPTPPQGSLPNPITITPSLVSTPSVTPALSGAPATVAPMGVPLGPSLPFTPIQPAIQVTGQHVTQEQPGEDSMNDLPGIEPDGTFAISANPNKEEEWKNAIEKLNEKFKAIEGSTKKDSWEIDDLCWYPKVEIPKKFRVPDFVKYDGTTNPELHLRSYCLLMGNWSREESFFLAFFHQSLTGSAYNWYMRLDRKVVKCWRDMVQAFKDHYRYIMDNAPTRNVVQALRMKPNETFREYANRWRQLASEVEPPLSNTEMSRYFVRTLPDPFHNLMIALSTKDFSKVIRIGEQIDMESKQGRIGSSSHNTFKKGFSSANASSKKKEEEVNYVQGAFSQQALGGSQRQDQRNRTTRDDRALPNFGISNDELFKRLMAQGVMGPIFGKTMTEPFPAWYKPDLTCIYHLNTPGHSIETCVGFRKHVLNLMDNGIIKIDQGAPMPNIAGNPLPVHGAGN